MEKNEVFTFTAPNGAEVTGIVLHATWDDVHTRHEYICYTQNRLFIGFTENQWVDTDKDRKQRIETPMQIGEVLAEYAVIPEYDKILEEKAE